MKMGYALLLIAMLLALTCLPACGVQASIYRVDEAQVTQTQKNLPLKCLFVECGEGKGS